MTHEELRDKVKYGSIKAGLTAIVDFLGGDAVQAQGEGESDLEGRLAKIEELIGEDPSIETS